MKNLYRNTAWLYDIDNRDNLHDDIPFYIDYAKSLGGEVLELGCGTGRVSLALARRGIKVTGLDLSDQMLDIFRQKINSETGLKDKLTLIHGDMTDFNIDKKFTLIIAPFRAFQSLTNRTDIKNALNCIYNHLTGNGIFIINVFKPFDILDESWCYDERVQWERLDEMTGNYIVKKHWGDKIDVENQIIYPHFAYEVTDKNGYTERHIEDLSLKYYYENQLEEVVTKAGFVISERFGWYDKRSIEEAKRELIFVCRSKINVRKDIYMRTITLSDAQMVFDAIDKNRDYLRPWLPWVDGTSSPDIVKKVITSWGKKLESGTDLVLGIFKNDLYIGNIGLHNMKQPNNSGMIGYWLDKHEQGDGIMTDCVRSLVDYGFSTLSLNRIYIHCADKNLKSRAVPERLNFVLEGILQDGEFLYGKYFDLALYGMVKRNWSA